MLDAAKEGASAFVAANFAGPPPRGLPPLPPIAKLSPRVIRVLGQNPSAFTLQGTNAYLIGTGPRRWLLDTGEGKPAFVANLRAAMTAFDTAATLAPHFAYGELDRPAYDAAHAMHVSEHLSEIHRG